MVKARVKIVNELSDVFYEHSKESSGLKTELVKFLKDELFEKQKIRFKSRVKAFDIDLIRSKAFGFAFAIEKFDDGFMDKSDPAGFRYKSDEVESVLTEAVNKFGMKPAIYYDRGFGVFVYNIFI